MPAIRALRATPKLLVERSLDVQPGWEVLIRSTPLARPLLRARAPDRAARRLRDHAHRLVAVRRSTTAGRRKRPRSCCRSYRRSIASCAKEWMHGSRSSRPRTPAPGNDLPAKRSRSVATPRTGVFPPTMTSEIPWIELPVPDERTRAGSGPDTRPAHRDRLRRVPARLGCGGRADAPLRRPLRRSRRGPHRRRGTDLTISLDGRDGEVDDGRRNMPGGEFFFRPSRARPTATIGLGVPGGARRPMTGIRLEFEGGKVVTRRPNAARTSSSASSTGTRARDESASSASAATWASRST